MRWDLILGLSLICFVLSTLLAVTTLEYGSLSPRGRMQSTRVAPSLPSKKIEKPLLRPPIIRIYNGSAAKQSQPKKGASEMIPILFSFCLWLLIGVGMQHFFRFVEPIVLLSTNRLDDVVFYKLRFVVYIGVTLTIFFKGCAVVMAFLNFPGWF